MTTPLSMTIHTKGSDPVMVIPEATMSGSDIESQPTCCLAGSYFQEKAPEEDEE